MTIYNVFYSLNDRDNEKKEVAVELEDNTIIYHHTDRENGTNKLYEQILYQIRQRLYKNQLMKSDDIVYIEKILV